MAVVLVDQDMPGWAYWRCTDCGWESDKFRPRDQGPEPGHACPKRSVGSSRDENIYFDDIDKP
jgi:hypothetical protein